MSCCRHNQAEQCLSSVELHKLLLQPINLLLQQHHLTLDGCKAEKINRLAVCNVSTCSCSVDHTAKAGVMLQAGSTTPSCCSHQVQSTPSRMLTCFQSFAILCGKQSHCCNVLWLSWSVASTLCFEISTLT